MRSVGSTSGWDGVAGLSLPAGKPGRDVVSRKPRCPNPGRELPCARDSPPPTKSVWRGLRAITIDIEIPTLFTSDVDVARPDSSLACRLRSVTCLGIPPPQSPKSQSPRPLAMLAYAGYVITTPQIPLENRSHRRHNPSATYTLHMISLRVLSRRGTVSRSGMPWR